MSNLPPNIAEKLGRQPISKPELPPELLNFPPKHELQKILWVSVFRLYASDAFISVLAIICCFILGLYTVNGLVEGGFLIGLCTSAFFGMVGVSGAVILDEYIRKIIRDIATQKIEVVSGKITDRTFGTNSKKPTLELELPTGKQVSYTITNKMLSRLRVKGNYRLYVASHTQLVVGFQFLPEHIPSLAEAFHFSADDLDNNREGYRGYEQELAAKKTLKWATYHLWVDLGLVGVVVLVGVWSTVRMVWELNLDGGEWFLVFWVTLVFFPCLDLARTVYWYRNLKRAEKTGRVLYVDLTQAAFNPIHSNLWYANEETQLRLFEDQWVALGQNRLYRFYYWSPNRHILSVEPVGRETKGQNDDNDS